MLKGICANYVIQTTKFIRLAVRKSKWLISHQVWEEEREFYLECLNVYMADFSKDHIIEDVKKHEKGQLMELIMEWLKEEMLEIHRRLKLVPMSDVVERLEVTLSLIYALQLCVYEKSQLPLHSFPMTEMEMSWYLEEYVEQKNMVKEFFILVSKGEKIA